MDLDHDDFAALALDVQDYVRTMKAEYAQYVNGATYALRFKPFIEVFHLGKLLVPQVQIGIQMYLNSPDFFTVRYAGADQLRLAPQDIKVKMLLCQVTLNPSVSRELFLKMDRHMVSYPAVRSELRTYNILAHGQVLRDQQSHPEPRAQPGGGGFDRSGRVQWRRDQEPLCLWEIQSVQYQAGW